MPYNPYEPHGGTQELYCEMISTLFKDLSPYDFNTALIDCHKVANGNAPYINYMCQCQLSKWGVLIPEDTLTDPNNDIIRREMKMKTYLTSWDEKVPMYIDECPDCHRYQLATPSMPYHSVAVTTRLSNGNQKNNVVAEWARADTQKALLKDLKYNHIENEIITWQHNALWKGTTDINMYITICLAKKRVVIG